MHLHWETDLRQLNCSRILLCCLTIRNENIVIYFHLKRKSESCDCIDRNDVHLLLGVLPWTKEKRAGSFRWSGSAQKSSVLTPFALDKSLEQWTLRRLAYTHIHASSENFRQHTCFFESCTCVVYKCALFDIKKLLKLFSSWKGFSI